LSWFCNTLSPFAAVVVDMSKTFALLFFLLLAGQLVAQQFPIQRIGVEEGLGHSITYRTYQSSNGYLWFSTDNGLTRFDGETFRNFTTQDGLLSNFVFDLEEWNNELYISTFGGGIMVYDGSRFRRLLADSTIVQHPIILEVFNNELWIVDRFKQLYQYSQNNAALIQPQHLNADTTYALEAYSLNGKGSALLISTNQGLYRYKDKSFKKISLPSGTGAVFNALQLHNGKLLIVTTTALLEFDEAQQQHRILLESKGFSPSTNIVEDHEGNVWVSMLDGTLYLLKASAEGERFNIRVLEGIVVNNMFEDRERNVWLSTYGEGAWCIRSIHVRNYPIRGSILCDLMQQPETKTIVVTTTNTGLKLFHQDKSNFLAPVEEHPLSAFFREKKYIVTALRTHDGTLCFSADRKLYISRKNKVDSLVAPGLISSMFEQKTQNRLWVGCRFALGYVEGGKMHEVPGFASRVIRSVAEDTDGSILLGTDHGVYKEQGKGFGRMQGEGRLGVADINALYKDSISSSTWVATSAGLGRIENGKLKSFDYPLAKVRCNSITGDNKGNVWIGTVSGLLHYNNNRFQLITTREGIAQSNIIKVMYDPKTDLLLLLTSNGLSVLDSKNFLADAKFQLPNILIEQVSSGNRSIPFSSTRYRLGKDQNELKVLISTPMVKNRDKITYSYRLNDEPWTEFNGRELTLNALPYGEIDLTIKVQERFKSGLENFQTLAFYVPRPFFLTWWFLLFVLFLLSASITALVFSFSKQKNKKLVEENKRLDVEHKALKNLLNPHFLYNAINSIHAFILQNDQRKTLAYLSKFSQLVRLNLELLSADRVSLDKELKNISLYLEFEKLRFADKLNYNIQVDPLIPQSDIQIPSFLIQPFLENAIWHGLLPREQGGNLLLRVDRVDDKLFITIDDDGVGINTSLKYPKPDLEKKTSMGINIIRDRIELLRKFSGDYALMIIDKTELNGKATDTGTVVKITVPISD
jgi:ligand-binding sensor domain-containing protein